uniref:Uncharacterized protein n=1 Tax=Anguilla anguilla TaxID=7936 RepID=A0A0E9V707_ANGAN
MSAVFQEAQPAGRRTGRTRHTHFRPDTPDCRRQQPTMGCRSSTSGIDKSFMINFFFLV